MATTINQVPANRNNPVPSNSSEKIGNANALSTLLKIGHTFQTLQANLSDSLRRRNMAGGSASRFTVLFFAAFPLLIVALFKVGLQTSAGIKPPASSVLEEEAASEEDLALATFANTGIELDNEPSNADNVGKAPSNEPAPALPHIQIYVTPVVPSVNLSPTPTSEPTALEDVNPFELSELAPVEEINIEQYKLLKKQKLEQQQQT